MPDLIASLSASVLIVSLAAGPADVDLPPPSPKAVDAEQTDGDPNAGTEDAPAKDPAVAAEEARHAEFDSKLQKARIAIDSRGFAEASKLLEEAYRLIPTRSVLLDWATAERYAGRCPRAVFLYERYLDSVSKDASAGKEQAVRKAEAAREGRAKCRETMDPSTPAPFLVIPPPIAAKPELPTAAEPETDETTPSPSSVQPGEADTKPDDKRKRSQDPVDRAKRDPVGWSLFGAGLFSFAGAGALFAVAHTGEPDPLTSPSHAAYLDAVDRSRNLEIGAWTFVGIGSALLVSGIVRLAFVSSRAHQRKAKRASVWSNWGRF